MPSSALGWHRRLESTPSWPLKKKIYITKLTGRVTPSWIARDGDVPQSDATFDADEIEPKSIGTQITMKRSALLYGNHPSVEPLMLADLRTAMLTELDRAVLFGEGGLAPVGVASLASPGHSLASLQDALRIRNEILSYEKNEEALRWLLPDLAVAYLSSTPRFPGATVATALDGNFLAGFPYVVNPIGAAGSPTITHQQYMLGNWAYAHLVLWDSVSILANPYGAGFASGAIDVRILCDGNVYVRDPNRIVVGDATILAM